MSFCLPDAPKALATAVLRNPLPDRALLVLSRLTTPSAAAPPVTLEEAGDSGRPAEAVNLPVRDDTDADKSSLAPENDE